MSTEYDEFQCYKGFLTAKSPTDNRTHVPFFVQVRDKDIIYEQANMPWPLKRLYERADSYEVTKPAENVIFSYNNWNINVTPNYRFRATRDFLFSDLDFKFDHGVDDTHFVGKFDVPFPIKADGACNIDITVQGDNTDILQATATSKFVKDIDVNAGITSFEIHLINMISRFDKDYNSNFTYGTSNFVITIEGTIGEI